jgi:Type IV secretion system pilin
MNTLKKLALTTAATAITLEQSFAAISLGGDKVKGEISGSTEGADTAVQGLVKNAMAFLAIVGVLYGIYGGFLMVTAGGDEEKVKKGRTILIQVAIGLVVIFLANSVVQFILDSVLVSN